MTHLPGIHIGNRARALTAALALGAAVLSLSAGPAHAAPNTPKDDGVRCASEEAGGHIDFYMPGDIVTTIDSKGVGRKLQCGKDGEWHPVRTVSNDSRFPRAPRGGVFAPVR